MSSHDEQTTNTDSKQSVWADVLRESLGQESHNISAIRTADTLLVCGNELDGKKHLLRKMFNKSQYQVLTDEHPLQYTYVRVNNSVLQSASAADHKQQQQQTPLSVNSPNSKNLLLQEEQLGRITNIWIMEDERFEALLNVCLTKHNLFRSCVLITLDASKPHLLLQTLNKWLELLSKHVTQIQQELQSALVEERKVERKYCLIWEKAL